MPTAITHHIKVSVESMYQPLYSDPKAGKYVHAYLVSIKNLSAEVVQLIDRHWVIWDANNVTKEVKGDGVVGQQPIIDPGQTHQYQSWCPLTTTIGKMSGQFGMIRVSDGHTFTIDIPEFKLIVPFKQN